MSKPIQAINRYKADLREFAFLLFEQFKLDELLGKAPFEAWGADECKTTLTECYRWVREVTARSTPSATPGLRARGRQGHDAARASRRRGRASTRPAGSRSRSTPSTAAPARRTRCRSSSRRCISGANTAFAMYPGLALRRGRGHRVVRHRRSRRSSTARACSAARGAARCASPSRRPAATSAARRRPRRATRDGSYAIRGTKIFISGGDHDLAENIVHLVLARVDGAPAGHQGAHALHRPEDPRRTPTARSASSNDVSVGEHRAQDGHQRLGDVRPQLRRRRQVHRLARRRRREAEPGHAADVQADERRAHRASASRASASRRARS